MNYRLEHTGGHTMTINTYGYMQDHFISLLKIKIEKIYTKY